MEKENFLHKIIKTATLSDLEKGQKILASKQYAK